MDLDKCHGWWIWYAHGFIAGVKASKSKKHKKIIKKILENQMPTSEEWIELLKEI